MAKAKFRRIEYDLFEALMRAKLPGSIYQVLLVVIDYTIGYRKETAKIPLSRFQQQTGLSRVGVIKAIRDAEKRHIISVDRTGVNAKTPASYTLSVEYTEWITGKHLLTSRLVNGSLLGQLTPVYQTGKQLTPATPVELNLNVTLRQNDSNKKTTPPDGLSRGVHHHHPTMSLPLYTPKGEAEANSLTNRHSSVLPREDRATLESDPSAPGSPSRGSPLGQQTAKATYQKRIEDYLRVHGPAAIKTIAEDTGIKANAVNVALHQGKGKLFCHFNAERIWGINE
jgi:phage replication O-like protein O